jgi:hypothetical protein
MMHKNIGLSPQLVPKEFRNGPDVTIPISMFLDMHNALPSGNEMRTRLREYIHAYACANQKAHWTRAVVEDADGRLRFDESLYSVAVYRGKQETRLAAAEEVFHKLQEQLSYLAGFQQDEHNAVTMVSVNVKPIVPMSEYSPQLALLQGNGQTISELATQMQKGLASTVIGVDLATDNDDDVT